MACHLHSLSRVSLIEALEEASFGSMSCSTRSTCTTFVINCRGFCGGILRLFQVSGFLGAILVPPASLTPFSRRVRRTMLLSSCESLYDRGPPTDHFLEGNPFRLAHHSVLEGDKVFIEREAECSIEVIEIDSWSRGWILVRGMLAGESWNSFTLGHFRQAIQEQG